jgi:hypothetical protein
MTAHLELVIETSQPRVSEHQAGLPGGYVALSQFGEQRGEPQRGEPSKQLVDFRQFKQHVPVCMKLLQRSFQPRCRLILKIA